VPRGAAARGACAAFGLGLAVAGLAMSAAPGAGDSGRAAPERPAHCRDVAPGADLQALLDAERGVASLCLAPGRYRGPLRIEGASSVWGPASAVVASSGEGTTIRLEGTGPALLGVTVDGSGGRFDLLDAAVHVSGADARVEGVAIRNATFGILVERAHGVRVVGNDVQGDRDLPFGLRGDGIRLWEAYDCTVERNTVRDGRDTVLWYASRNRVIGNRIERGRYGVHLMYSHENELRDNRFVANVTGAFVMYSRRIDVQRNLFAAASGAAGVGLGLKESGDVRVEDNAFVRDTIAIYIDSSPLWPDDRNRFARNLFRLSDVPISFLATPSRSEFIENDFRDARVAVEVNGGGDALAVTWQGNHFDDYAGYDLDGDGTGDVPYELRSLSSDLVSETPQLAFYRGTPALALAETIGRIVPIVQPRLLVVDREPRLRPREESPIDAD
jgi:nitrous oxidase accessory protein